jgi:DNA-binding LacI/PurR family transcriptional regulator
MPMTVAEIGKLVGCSGATVSRAINSSGAVSPKTRAAILNAVRTHDVSPARQRRGRPSGQQRARESGLVEILYFRDTPIERLSADHGEVTVGPYGHWNDAESIMGGQELSSSFYRRIIGAAAAELGDWGHRAVIEVSRNLASPEAIADVNRPDRAGILLLGQYGPFLPTFVEQCLHPLVLVDLIQHGPSDVVTTDNMLGIGKAFDHLYELGHRKIGFAGKVLRDVAFMERFNAFRWKMSEAGLPLRDDWVYEGTHPMRLDQTQEGIVRLLKQKDRPMALLCANDCTALSVVRAAAHLGLRIPQDLSVVGFDDDEAAALVTPALTTVRIPVLEMGRQAVRQLMLQIQHPQPPRQRGVHIRLIPDLVVRSSTARP